MANLRGINLAMQTPFTDDGAVDYGRFEELIEIYLDAGMHGILFSSGTGQHPYLTEDECNKMFELGIKRIDGRANVMCQTSALNQDEVIRRSKTAQDLGADALLILPPYFEGPAHDDGVFRFYETINASVLCDIVGYNIPASTGFEMSPTLFGRLVELEHFTCIKDSSGDFGKQQALLATGGPVLNGADTLTPYSFMAGCFGTIWGCANIFPREAVELFDLVEAGRHGDALVLWRRLFPIVEYCWHGDYMPAVKAACRLAGYGGGPVRAPVCDLGPEAEAEIARRLEPLTGQSSAAAGRMKPGSLSRRRSAAAGKKTMRAT